MSKSIGNIVSAKDMIERVGGVVTRLVILNTHYRMPVNFTDDTVKAAAQEVNKMSMAYKQAALALQVNGYNLQSGKANMDNFISALADDLNTANALSELYNVVKETNQLLRTRPVDYDKLLNNFKTLTDMFYCLGLDIKYVVLSDEDKSLYKEYNLSKENKDFAKSDELRKILIEKGIM